MDYTKAVHTLQVRFVAYQKLQKERQNHENSSEVGLENSPSHMRAME
jgi:hypothetical protein